MKDGTVIDTSTLDKVSSITVGHDSGSGWSPHDFINEAASTIDQRGTDNGYDAGKERSAAKIAELFNTLTGQKLSEQDVWTLLICLKLVRNQRKFKTDNIVDLIGYSSLLGECLSSTDSK